MFLIFCLENFSFRHYSRCFYFCIRLEIRTLSLILVFEVQIVYRPICSLLILRLLLFVQLVQNHTCLLFSFCKPVHLFKSTVSNFSLYFSIPSYLLSQLNLFLNFCNYIFFILCFVWLLVYQIWTCTLKSFLLFLLQYDHRNCARDFFFFAISVLACCSDSNLIFSSSFLVRFSLFLRFSSSSLSFQFLQRLSVLCLYLFALSSFRFSMSLSSCSSSLDRPVVEPRL